MAVGGTVGLDYERPRGKEREGSFQLPGSEFLRTSGSPSDLVNVGGGARRGVRLAIPESSSSSPSHRTSPRDRQSHAARSLSATIDERAMSAYDKFYWFAM